MYLWGHKTEQQPVKSQVQLRKKNMLTILKRTDLRNRKRQPILAKHAGLKSIISMTEFHAPALV
jgi:hypothetical protein